MIKFVADSSCDIHTYKGINFESVPISISTSEKEYIDNETLNLSQMLSDLEKYQGKSNTACPSVERWIQAFDGADEVYVVTITSGLSGTYNSALVAKEMYLAEHPEAKVHVFDSLSTGPEMRMALDYAVNLKEKGYSFEETCAMTQKYLDDTHLLFVLGSVHNLAQNGRVSKVIASAIGVLKINLIGIADEAGTIKQIGKARGEKRIISNLMGQLKTYGYQGGRVCISHVENESLCKALQSAILASYPDADIIYYPAGGLCSFYAERGGILLGFE